MHGCKVRYAVTDMNLKVSNVTLPECEASYVLLTASDDYNEIVIELSHQQSEYLEDQFYEANRRWEEQYYAKFTPDLENDTSERSDGNGYVTPPL